MVRVVLACFLLLLMVSCGAAPEQPDVAAEWRRVLDARRAATADPRLMQSWADELHAFLQRHPDHARARQVWEELEIENARRLADAGRPAEGLARLRNLLESKPRERHQIREAMESLENQLHVTGDELAQVRTGLTPGEVEALLGAPPAGWRHKSSSSSESWYYRSENGSTSAIHFHRGKVIAVDDASERTSS